MSCVQMQKLARLQRKKEKWRIVAFHCSRAGWPREKNASRKPNYPARLVGMHPESDLAGFAAPIFIDGPNVYQDARNRWLTQVNLHPDDARFY